MVERLSVGVRRLALVPAAVCLARAAYFVRGAHVLQLTHHGDGGAARLDAQVEASLAPRDGHWIVTARTTQQLNLFPLQPTKQSLTLSHNNTLTNTHPHTSSSYTPSLSLKGLFINFEYITFLCVPTKRTFLYKVHLDKTTLKRNN